MINIMAYKHVPTPLSEIPPGSPIYINNPSAFCAENGRELPSRAYLGILTRIVSGRSGGAHPCIAEFVAGKLSLERRLYKSGANVNSYMNLYLHTTSTYISILTGPKGEELRAAYTDYLFMNKLNVHGALSITSGADPELFICDASGEMIPAWKYLPSKEESLSAYMKAKNNLYGGDVTAFATQHAHAYWDGVQAEFGITSGTCMGYGCDYIQEGLKLTLTSAQRKFPKARISTQSVHKLTPSMIADASGDQIALGCLPSLNAYGMRGEVVENGRDLPFRFAGGHVHLGYDDFRKGDNPQKIVKALDAVVGVATVGMFAKLDNPLRRRFYGLAGEYRLPAHGIEYRVLSNAWLTHPALCMWVFDMCRGVATAAFNNLPILPSESESEITRIINEYDVEAARSYCAKYKRLYHALSLDYYDSPNAGDITMQMITEGVESVVDPQNVEGNWKLGSGGWTSHTASARCQFVSLCKEIAAEERRKEIASRPKVVAVEGSAADGLPFELEW